MNTFSIKEALSAGWNLTKGNFGLLLGVMITLAVISWLPGWVGGALNIKDGFGVGLLQLISFVVGALAQLGLIHIALSLVDGKKPAYKELFGQTRFLLPYIVASILVGLMVIAGLILFIIPGFIVALMVGMYGYHMVDTKAGILASIQGSAALTKGYRWQLFGFLLLCAVINLVGALLFGIGLLITWPTTILAYAYVYRKLSGQLIPAVAAPIAPTLIEDLRKTT